jgi:hypothetical protein
MCPGGVQYEDPRTPAAKWHDEHTWPADRAQQIIAFRQANPTIYPEPEWTNPAFVLAQVNAFNCQRLGNDGAWCMETGAPAPVAPLPASRVCECGGAIVEKYCPTCSGRRVIGHQCAKCGKEYPK